MNASIRTASLIALAWASLLVYVAGCGSDGGDGSTATDGPPEPIDYDVTIGYPPTFRTLSIDADGNAVTTVRYPDDEKDQRDQFTVPADQLSAIRAHLAASDLSDIPDDGCVDCVYVTLTYGDEEGGGGTMTAPQENEDTPEDLRIALEMLDDLLPPAQKGG